MQLFPRRFAVVQLPVSASYGDDILAIALPGATCTLGRVMGDHLFGSLDLNVGSMAPHLSANLVRDSTALRVAGKLQVNVKFLMAVVKLCDVWNLVYHKQVVAFAEK